MLDFTVPRALASADGDRLLRNAFTSTGRTFLSQGFQAASAEAAIKLAKRQVFPDIAISAQYSQTGTNTNARCRRRASSSRFPRRFRSSISSKVRSGKPRRTTTRSRSPARAKLTAQVVSDVATAASAFRSSRGLVERMEKALKPSAERAFSITRVQYDKSAATLMDLLDAQRTYIAANVEYLQDLANYWTAVFQLEQAVGMELRQ